MDKSELAQLMLDWERKKGLLDELEAAINDTVLQFGETVITGNVKAVYNGGRKTYDYRIVGGDASVVLKEQYSKTVIKTDWRKLVLEGMKKEQGEIPFSQSPPSVSVKLV